jgi:hypothetical protein
MPDYDVLCLPLFFATAWLRSNRALGSTLSYNLPLSLRWRFPCIRWYWLCELVLSTVALAIYSPLAGMSGRLFPPSGASLLPGLETANGVSHLSYPMAAVTLGFLWPQISSFSIAMGAARQRLSLGAVRDYLLGGPITHSINSRLQAEVSSYVGRILAAVDDAGESGAQILQALGLARSLPATPEAREQLRETLMKRAEADFESLYLLVGQVKMVPLMDRRRPLMKVADMTAQEEEKLYQAGVETVGDLVHRARRGVAGLPADRLEVLRRNAHRLLGQRLRMGLSLAGIAAVVVGLGIGSRRLYVPDHRPQPGEPVKIGSSPQARAEGPLTGGEPR